MIAYRGGMILGGGTTGTGFNATGNLGNGSAAADTDAASPDGMPWEENTKLGSFVSNIEVTDGVSRAPMTPIATLMALAAAGRNPADITIAVLTGGDGEGGGDSGSPLTPVAADDRDALTKWLDGWWDWLTGPGEPPPSDSERIVPQVEMDRQDASLLGPDIRPGSLPLHRGETAHNATDQAFHMIAVTFPLYAGEKLLDAAMFVLWGPEELAALEAAAAAKGLTVQIFKQGRNWVMKFGRAQVKKSLGEVTEAEIKAMAQEVRINSRIDKMAPGITSLRTRTGYQPFEEAHGRHDSRRFSERQG